MQPETRGNTTRNTTIWPPCHIVKSTSDDIWERVKSSPLDLLPSSSTSLVLPIGRISAVYPKSSRWLMSVTEKSRVEYTVLKLEYNFFKEGSSFRIMSYFLSQSSWTADFEPVTPSNIWICFPLRLCSFAKCRILLWNWRKIFARVDNTKRILPQVVGVKGRWRY